MSEVFISPGQTEVKLQLRPSLCGNEVECSLFMDDALSLSLSVFVWGPSLQFDADIGNWTEEDIVKNMYRVQYLNLCFIQSHIFIKT